MFVSGMSPFLGSVFTITTLLIAVPSAVKTFNWLGTVWGARIQFTAPALFSIGFVSLFITGGLSGIFLGTSAADIQLQDTYFVVAHFHYVMMGGAVTAFLGGLHYWWPKVTGRMYSEKVGRLGAVMVLVGMNVTFFPQFVLGTRGMPRRYYNYLEEFQGLHQLSTVGAYILGLAFVITAVSLWSSLKNGKKASANPWGGTTLEWAISSPPPYYNFQTPPEVNQGPYDGYENLRYDDKLGGYLPKKAEA
jgi:cytochrome c oxidase subunit 1